MTNSSLLMHCTNSQGPRFSGRGLGIGAASIAALLSACVVQQPAPAPALARDRTAVLLAINDVYRVEGLQEGTYQMLNRSQVASECKANGVDLKELVIQDLKAAEPAGIAPRIEGRICQATPGAPCLAVAR